MPDIRKHRGPHPEDRSLFSAKHLPSLRQAVSELSWLLTREYSIKAALKLVGDRHRLRERQRLAVSRAACSDQSKASRRASAVNHEVVRGGDLIVDGFNLLITIEAALSGGVLILCRDGCIRDLSSVHGSYRSVDETDWALQLIGEALATTKPASVRWLLDQPISNSGRLATRVRAAGERNAWPWRVETAFNPDREIASSAAVVISSDGPLLDQVDRWLNFARQLIEKRLDTPWLIDLS
jgi:hypothetical protein